MALTVEDGTGLDDADAYISVDDADNYHDGRANAAWDDLADEAKEAAIRKATEYLDAVYARRWAGVRASDAQALAWPRANVEVDGVVLADDALPQQLVRACAELALKASAGDLAADVGRMTTREKIGEIEVQYDTNRAPYTTYRYVDALLAPLLLTTSGGVSRQVIRT